MYVYIHIIFPFTPKLRNAIPILTNLFVLYRWPPGISSKVPRKSMFDSSFFVELNGSSKWLKNENCSKLWRVFSGHMCGHIYVGFPWFSQSGLLPICKFFVFFPILGVAGSKRSPNFTVDISARARVPHGSTSYHGNYHVTTMYSEFFWESSFSGICLFILFGDCWRIGIPWDEKNHH